MSASSDIKPSNDNDDNGESNVGQFDDLECLFQDILINKDYNEVCLLQKPKEHIALEDNFELPYLVKNNAPDELLVLSTPTKEGKRKLQRQNRQDEAFETDNELFAINDIVSNYNILNDQNETEHAKQYLQMYSTPNHRWSIDMIPNNNFQYHTTTNLDSNLKRQKLSQQSKSFEDEYFSMIESKSKADLGTSKLTINNEKEETNSIFYDTRSIPIIINNNNDDNHLKIPSLKSSWILERLKHLAQAYDDRGTFVKKAIDELNAKNCHLDQDSNDDDDDDDDEEEEVEGEENFGNVANDNNNNNNNYDTANDQEKSEYSWKCFKNIVYEPQSYQYISWLLVVSLCFLYNAIFIPFRLVFPYSHYDKSLFIWLDLGSDFINTFDMFWFKPRLKYLSNGHFVDLPKATHLHYFHSKYFLLDVFSQFPLDWLGFIYQQYAPIVIFRSNRMLMIRNFWEFFERIDMITKNPYLFRIIHTLIYELYIIHLGACLYYKVSEYIGFGQTAWTFDNEGNAYLRCFYFAFRTTNSIGGRIQKPTNEFERIYMLTAWLFGVFVFAMIIGQIRDIVAHASRNQNYYIDALNKIGAHMNQLNVRPKLQKRVRFWFKFTWDLQKTFNELEILRKLPLKMRTDLLLSIYSQTLSRVDLFKNINRSVLRDLVLKFEPILFLPGDYVCRKGDVGHEMYIVNKGTIQVIDSDSRKVVATLSEGSVFGEIAILNLHGQTKRTADVRSCGYSQLFALKKQDLWETLRYYPEYENILKAKVKRILKKKRRKAAIDKSNNVNVNVDEGQAQNDDKDSQTVIDQIQVESIVKERCPTPKLFQTVMQAVQPQSTLNQYFVKHRLAYSLSFDQHSTRMENTLDAKRISQVDCAKSKQKSLDYDHERRKKFFSTNP